MELHAEDVVALDDRRERVRMRRRGDAFDGDRRGVRVREVDLRAGGQSLEQARSAAAEVERVPSHVRHFQPALQIVLQSPDAAWNHAEPLYLRRFVARSEERRVGKECRSRWSPYA